MTDRYEFADSSVDLQLVPAGPELGYDTVTEGQRALVIGKPSASAYVITGSVEEILAFGVRIQQLAATAAWSEQHDDILPPGTWPLSTEGTSVPDGLCEYAFDTTTDLRVRVWAGSEAAARQEVLTGAGDFLELYERVGPLLVTTGSVQTIVALVEVTDRDGNSVDWT